MKAITKKIRKNTLISIILSIFLVPIAIVSLSADNLSKPTKDGYVTYSVNKNNPNLIVMLIDSLSYHPTFEKIIGRKEFKDFGIVQKFSTFGYKTNLTMPTLLGDTKKWNPLKIIKDNNINGSTDKIIIEKYSDLFEEGLFADLLIDNINNLKDIVPNFQKVFINANNASKQNSNRSTDIGDPEELYRRDKDIKVINWTRARDLTNNNGWGISNSSANANFYKFINKAKINKDGGPTRVLFQNHIFHGSKKDLPDYSMTKQGNMNLSADSFIAYSGDTWEALKNIKDPQTGVSIYDNSMIVIIGDHRVWDSDKKIYFSKGETDYRRRSLMMIKYPNQIYDEPQILNTIAVASTDVNMILRDYFNNKQAYANNPLEKFKSLPSFELDRKLVNFNGYEMYWKKDLLYWSDRLFDLTDFSQSDIEELNKIYDYKKGDN